MEQLTRASSDLFALIYADSDLPYAVHITTCFARCKRSQDNLRVVAKALAYLS